MKTQIPIYRAKKIDSNEYVEGYCSYSPDIKQGHDECNELIHFINSYKWTCTGWKHVPSIIDPSTLAIHFPDSSSTQSEKVWYNMEEISNIIKEYEDGKVEKR